MVTVREDLLLTHSTEIEKILKIVNESCSEVKASQDSIKEISERYQLKEADVAVWFNETQWACNADLESEIIDQVQERLIDLEIIDAKMDFDMLCKPFDEQLESVK